MDFHFLLKSWLLRQFSFQQNHCHKFATLTQEHEVTCKRNVFILLQLPFAIDIDFSFVALISLNLARLGSVFEHKKENNFLLLLFFPSTSPTLNIVVVVVVVDVTNFSYLCVVLEEFFVANRKQLRRSIFKLQFL